MLNKRTVCSYGSYREYPLNKRTVCSYGSYCEYPLNRRAVCSYGSLPNVITLAKMQCMNFGGDHSPYGFTFL